MSTQLNDNGGLADQAAPLYIQIQRRIRNDIAAGAHAAGDRLPSESELASEFHTTRTTVRHALSQLVFEGQVALLGRTVTYRSFTYEMMAAPRPVAERLRLEPDAEIFRLERLRV